MLGGDITYGFKYFKSRVVQEINSQDKLILAEGNTNSQLLMSKQVNIVKCINIMGVKRVHYIAVRNAGKVKCILDFSVRNRD